MNEYRSMMLTIMNLYGQLTATAINLLYLLLRTGRQRTVTRAKHTALYFIIHILLNIIFWNNQKSRITA